MTGCLLWCTVQLSCSTLSQIRLVQDGSVTKVKRAVKLLKGAASEGDRGEFVREAEVGG